MQLDGKIIVLTGATSGIGEDAAFSLAGMGSILVLPVRNMEKGGNVKNRIIEQTGNADIHLMECDLASFESIRGFSAAFKSRFNKLHVLINNAGLWERDRKETADGIEMNFGVNHLAPFLLTNLLLDELRSGAPSRVINVSSSAHRYGKIDFDDPEGKKRYCNIKAYGQSKNANILFTRHLSRMVKKDGTTVNCLHPGFVATHLFDRLNPVIRYGGRLFMINPHRGADTIVHLASSGEVGGVTGEYFARKKIRKPAASARDDTAAEKLWKLSRQYTGI